MRNLVRHLGSFIAPLVMCFGLPYLIVRYESWVFTRPMVVPPLALRFFGGLLALGGLALLAAIIRLFIRIGRGTIMPWDPSRHMVTAGFYGRMRNPMISSILVVQVGEALLFASNGIGFLALLFFAVNHVYFILSEEPGLEKRFGEQYREYKRNVPRWIPRLKPWKPRDENLLN
jgi:protein-S-isoprenylcysteine O-methyltransferase Ste14